jgi:hypothetical protein
MTLMEDVAALQARIEKGRRDRARAEGARDAAQAAADNARAELKRDFDVDTVEQAEELLIHLRNELAELTAEMDAHLGEIGV